MSCHSHDTYLQVLVKVPELLHLRECLDPSPRVVGEEGHWTIDVGQGWETQQEVQLIGVYLLSLEQDLEGDL